MQGANFLGRSGGGTGNCRVRRSPEAKRAAGCWFRAGVAHARAHRSALGSVLRATRWGCAPRGASGATHQPIALAARPRPGRPHPDTHDALDVGRRGGGATASARFISARAFATNSHTHARQPRNLTPNAASAVTHRSSAPTTPAGRVVRHGSSGGAHPSDQPRAASGAPARDSLRGLTTIALPRQRHHPGVPCSHLAP